MAAKPALIAQPSNHLRAVQGTPSRQLLGDVKHRAHGFPALLRMGSIPVDATIFGAASEQTLRFQYLWTRLQTAEGTCGGLVCNRIQAILLEHV